MTNPKNLYISDLDGTLLNSSKEVSKYSKDIINDLIKDGMKFSVATARTSGTVVRILSELNMNVPLVLMNGVAIYDLERGLYLKTNDMSKDTANAVIDILETCGVDGFVYTIHGNSLVTYYKNLERKAMRDFHDERVNVYGKRFEQVKNLSEGVKEGKILYFTMLDEYDKLKGAFEALKKMGEINAAFYRDVYAEGMWFLEVYSNKASKSSAAQYLGKEYGFTHITGFGDNFNDIPLLSACDEFYAVLNAVDELKKRATGIIYDNNSDGVARFLYEQRCT